MPEKTVSIKAVFAKKVTDNKDDEDKAGTEKETESKITTGNQTANTNTNSNQGTEIATVPSKDNANKDKSKAKETEKSAGAEGSKLSLSPLTGDFVTKDNIRVLLLIQSIALILICVALKRKEKVEQIEQKEV